MYVLMCIVKREYINQCCILTEWVDSNGISMPDWLQYCSTVETHFVRHELSPCLAVHQAKSKTKNKWHGHPNTYT